MSPRRRHPFRPNARGGFEVHLGEDERALLTTLPEQVMSALEELGEHDRPVPDALRRLVPPAYPRDASSEDAYVRLVRDDLVAHHREALETLSSTAQVTHLDEAGLTAWLTAMNDLRLVIGTTLGVTEDGAELAPDDPHYGEWLCYHYLSFLASEAVEALSFGLPEADPLADGELPDDPWGEPPGGLRWDGTAQPEP